MAFSTKRNLQPAPVSQAVAIIVTQHQWAQPRPQFIKPSLDAHEGHRQYLRNCRTSLDRVDSLRARMSF